MNELNVVLSMEIYLIFLADLAVSDESANNAEILAGLEKIDSETDNLDITFIKINDPRLARNDSFFRLYNAKLST